jgi:hypothetical protein
MKVLDKMKTSRMKIKTGIKKDLITKVLTHKIISRVTGDMLGLGFTSQVLHTSTLS